MSQLYSNVFTRDLAIRFTRTNRETWPASVVIALDPEVWGERQAIEFIFGDFPNGRSKNDLLQRLQSEDDETFVGGWAQLRVWALLDYRGLRPIPEPSLPNVAGKPDFVMSWPIRKGERRTGIVEVMASSAGAKSQGELRKKLLDRLQKKAGKYANAALPYIVAVVIGGPPSSGALSLAVSDLKVLQTEAGIELYRNLSATLFVETCELCGDGHLVETRQTLIHNRNPLFRIDEVLPQLLSHELTDDEAEQRAGFIESEGS